MEANTEEWRLTAHGECQMDRSRRIKKDEEGPLGIVISNGARTEDAPRFSAYVWGPVPEVEELAREPEQELIAVA